MAGDRTTSRELHPRRFRLPEGYELPSGSFRAVYDALGDVLFVHFFGKALPAVTAPIDHGDRAYVYLRIDPNQRRVVGLQIDDFLAVVARAEPDLLAALAIADLPDLDAADAAALRRMGRDALGAGWDEGAFLHEVEALIA
jgi:hypothetical protein